MSRTYGIGPVPENIPEGLQDFLRQLRIIAIAARDGSLPGTGGGGTGGSRGSTTVVTVPGGGGAGDEPDATPPPTPTNVLAVAGIDFVGITTDPPTFTEGHGYGRTIVYGAKWPLDQPVGPTFSNAVKVHEFVGEVGSFPSDPNTRWCLWLKWRSRDGYESSSPSGGAGGHQVTTGQDPTKLLEILQAQITESHLYGLLTARLDLIDGNGVNSVNARIAAEAAQRVSDLAQEAFDRTTAIQAEATARGQAILDEAALRASGDAALQTQINTVVAATTGDLSAVLAAIQEEQTARTNADTAEAASRETLATQIRGNYTGTDPTQLATGLMFNERQARVSADTAIVNSVSALTATVNSNQSSVTAAITAEQTARAQADAAEAAARTTLAAQLTGGYSGTDVTQLVSGLIYNERVARTTQDEVIAQQIALLSAGSSDQFDYAKIWYFDSTVEGWTGAVAGASSSSVVASVSGGWLRMVAASGSVSNAQVVSPAALGVNGGKYPQVRARIRKFGSPTWEGSVYFLRNGESSWVGSQLATIAAPSFDANGISVVTWDMPSVWLAATIDRIRIDLASATTTTDYFEIDWVAVGRPSPGASAAALADEQVARAAADSAEVTARQTLSSKLTGLPDPGSATLGSLTAGLLYDERTARTSADSALSTSITNLQASVNSSVASLNASITAEQTARANADTANANAINTVNARLNSGGDTYQSIVNVQAQASAAQTTASTAASQVTTVQSRLDNGNAAAFEPVVKWEFDAGAEGWTPRGIGGDTLVAAGGVIEYATTTQLGYIRNSLATADRFVGSTRPVVRFRVRWTAGTVPTTGTFMWVRDGSATTWSVSITVPAGTAHNTWVVIDVDLSGQTEWMTQTINQLRINLAPTFPLTQQFDWIATGKRGTGISAAAVQQEISTRASETGYLGAQWTVRMDIGGRAVGFGIAGTSEPGAQPSVDFGIVADRFYIAPPVGTTGVNNITPFVVQATPVTTAAGEVLPAGVYIDAAYIRNLTANLGRFQNAIITSAMIVSLSASKITAGSLAVGQYIQSSAFVPGGTGFRLDGGGGIEVRSTGGTRVLNINASGSQPVLKIGSALEVLANGGITVGDGSGGILFATGGSVDWSRIGGTARPRAFRVVSRGNGASGYPLESGFYDAETGAALHGAARSYMLVVGNRATGTRTFQYYDVFGDGANSQGRNAAWLASDMNSLTSASWFVLYTHDEPLTNRQSGGLQAAIYKNGGTPGKFESNMFAYRGAYMLIGIGGCGPGNALFEGYAGTGTDTGDFGPDNAWIDTTFQVVNGNLIASGSGLGGFQINTTNVDSYVAEGSIGDTYIGKHLRSFSFNGTIDANGVVTNVGTQGWAIGKGGLAVLQDAYVRGDVQATSLNAATGVFAGSLAAGVIDSALIVGANYQYTSPGTYSVPAMPYTGTVRFTIVGGGGGGASGGTDRSGRPGGAGNVYTLTVTGVPIGAAISVTIGTGGSGGAQHNNPGSPNAGSAGSSTTITINGTTYTALGGSGGTVNVGYSGLPNPVGFTYHCQDAGDSAGINIAGQAPAAAVTGSTGGARALAAFPAGAALGFRALASNATALNGGNGTRGGGGGGGAPTRAWVGSRGFYIDPVDGEGGDGQPTSKGGDGGAGYAFVEVFNPNAVVLRSEWDTLIQALQRQGIATT